MARLVSKNEINVTGPWLLDRENLSKLNATLERSKLILDKDSNQLVEQKIDEEWTVQEKRNNRDSKEAIRKKILESYEFKIENKAVITTSEQEMLYGQNLYELLISRDLEKVKPIRLSYQIKRGPSELLLNFSESTFFGGLEFKLSLSDEALYDDIKFQLQEWINEYKPKRPVKVWSHFGLIGSFLFFLLFAFLFFTYNGINNPATSYKSFLVKKTDSLIDSGITDIEHDKALELILEFHEAEAGYAPKEYFNSRLNYSLLAECAILYFILTLILSIRTPKPFIGLGLNEKQARFRKWWYQFVTVSVPLFFISALIEIFIERHV